MCENEEVKMLNIRNRKKKEEVIEGKKEDKKIKEGQVKAKGPVLH